MMRLLKKALALARFTQQHPQHSITEALQMAQEQRQAAWTRRQFMTQTAQASASLVIGGTLLGSTLGCKKEQLNTNAQVVIVGAGMAGLRAANELKKAGLNAQIYEAATRHGGRMYTAHNIMASGLSTELGGEFIDTIHDDMLQLASEFGLTLIDTQTDNLLIKDAYFFNNTHYSVAQLVAELQSILPAMQADIDNLPDYIAYTAYNTATQALDNQSIEQYLTNIGATGWALNFLIEAFVTEYGLNADQQSSINMLFLTDTDTSSGEYAVFGESDERYKIAGGNQQITDRLADAVIDQIIYDQRLTALSARTGGGFTLTFTSGASVTDVQADAVLLTLPFSVLRNIDLHDNLQLPTVKRNSIEQLGYGNNAKLMLGFNNRPWRTAGYTGYLFTDNGIQTGWDNSQLQGGTAGGYTCFSGGSNGVAMGSGTPESQAAIYLPRLDEVFAGAQSLYNNNVQRMHWPTVATALGSYACYRPGQWTSIAGAESESVGGLFFAGEHCSFDYQGYMNGAAETGRRAANDIIDWLTA